MTLQTALLQGTKLLEEAGVAVPRLTAEVLLCHTIHRERPYLYAHPEQELREVEWIHFGRYLHERIGGKPTQYITRRQEFYGREFRVTPDVLIPRPETEHVIEIARKVGGRRVLDIGTGSGAIAVTLALDMPAAVFATDVSLAALAVASENARRLGATVGFVACDLISAVGPASIDLLVSNPPYVPLADEHGLQREVRDFEPHVALFGGPTGLEVYRRIAEDAPRVLSPGGWIVLELGFGTHDEVAAMFAGWRDAHIEPDLAGIPRVFAARRR